MFLLKQILPAVIMAMVVAAGICSLGLYVGRDRARKALAPVAIGIAYLSGHLFVAGWATFPPSDTTNWLPYFALAVGVLGALCELFPTKAWIRVIVLVAVSTGALRLLLKPRFQYGWSVSQGWVWILSLAGAILLLALILDALVRLPVMAIELPAWLAIIAGGTFAALMLSGSMLLGQLAALLGAAVFGTLVFVARKVALGRGVAPVFALLLGVLLTSGYFFAELPLASAILLACAPGFALLPIGTPGKMLAFGIRSALVSLPVLVAIGLAFRSSPPLDY